MGILFVKQGQFVFFFSLVWGPKTPRCWEQQHDKRHCHSPFCVPQMPHMLGKAREKRQIDPILPIYSSPLWEGKEGTIWQSRVCHEKLAFWGRNSRILAGKAFKNPHAEPQRLCKTLGAKPGFSDPASKLSGPQKRPAERGNVKKRRKSTGQISTFFDIFCAGQKASKIVKKVPKIFSTLFNKCRHFSTNLARHLFSGPFLEGSDKGFSPSNP